MMAPSPPDFPTCDHPDRPHRALGLCQACYSRWRRQVQRDTADRIARRLRELEISA